MASKSQGSFLRRHPKAAMFASLCVIVAVVVWLTYSWLIAAMQTAARPATQAYFYDTATQELVAGPVGALAPIARPGGTAGGEATCVRAYVMSCGSCAEESGRFVGYLMRLNPEYKKALDAAPAPQRARLVMPLVYNFSAAFFPALSTAAGKATGSEPAPKRVIFGESDRIQLALMPASAKDKLQWKAPMKAETEKLMASLRDKCGGQTPVACDPAEPK
jgi:hypothetical protein